MDCIVVRGYYYDTETGFYYLQTRYYDPAICRFINADTFATTDIDGLLSTNMFSYCENNPVMGVDPTGEWVHLLVGAVVGAVVGGITSAVTSYKQSGSVDIGSALLGAATGAVSGLVGASGLGAGAQALVSGVIGGVSELYDAHKNGRDVNALDVVMGVAIGATSSLIGSAATRGMVDSSKTLINKGINKIVSGKAKFDSGGRYWKGSIKRGLQYFNEGIKSLHIAQGKSSVIGSISGGTLSLTKTCLTNQK